MLADSGLAGLSGVGKSSLLSAVEPGLNLKIGEVSERRQEGRHTTAQVSLHPLAAGGFVVDTPASASSGWPACRRPTCRASTRNSPTISEKLFSLSPPQMWSWVPMCTHLRCVRVMLQQTPARGLGIHPSCERLVVPPKVGDFYEILLSSQDQVWSEMACTPKTLMNEPMISRV